MRFTPRSRASWRRWLQSHHDATTEVWLVFYKRHTGKRTLTYNDAVEEAVCFGWIDGIRQRIDDERYMHRFSPRQADSSWSATNRQRVARMEEAGLMTEAGRKAIRTAKRKGKWRQAQPEIDMSMPRELRARLGKNEAAARFFDSLAASYRRQFIAWINAAKRAETRTRRLNETIELLERGEKLGMR